jgi:PleD family two-component response regulator
MATGLPDLRQLSRSVGFVYLCCVRNEEDRPAVESRPAVQSYALGARTVLVLDADPAVAPAIQRALGNAWRVFGVSDGHAALSFLAGILADVIFVDGDTLATAGTFVVARERDPRLAFVPIIGIGPSATHAFVSRAVAKPLADEAVRAAVTALADGSQDSD